MMINNNGFHPVILQLNLLRNLWMGKLNLEMGKS